MLVGLKKQKVPYKDELLKPAFQKTIIACTNYTCANESKLRYSIFLHKLRDIKGTRILVN